MVSTKLVSLWPFWMTENQFRSHFSAFQINTQLLFFWTFFHNMAAGCHFGSRRITSDRISRYFGTIRNFDSFKIIFSQNDPRQPIWMTENHFCSNFSPFQINTQFFFFKTAAVGHFWMTENHFRLHFSPFQINTHLFLKFIFTKWLPATILDDRKSLSIAFLAISEQYATFICFNFFSHKMTENHF